MKELLESGMFGYPGLGVGGHTDTAREDLSGRLPACGRTRLAEISTVIGQTGSMSGGVGDGAPAVMEHGA